MDAGGPMQDLRGRAGSCALRPRPDRTATNENANDFTGFAPFATTAGGWHTPCNIPGMLNRPSRLNAPTDGSPDLELVAQRIVKLAEIATLEHLELLLSSQAKGMLMLAQETDADARRGS
jgi:hypothetical protein